MNDKEWHAEIDERVEQARRDYKGPHCCLTMERCLAMNCPEVEHIHTFFYIDGKYKLQDPDSGDLIEVMFCFFCGKRINE